MAERLSPLAHLGANAAGAGGVALALAPYASILQVQAWPDTLPTVEAIIISELLDEQFPGQGTAISRNGAVVAAVAPGKFMIAAEADDLPQNFEAALLSENAAVTDLSHGRTILRLGGEAAVEVLSSCIAMDLDPNVFPPSRVAQTMIHHIDVLVHRTSETSFELWVLRSFAEALAEWILDAAER